jgi:uncharacterized protein (DUF983 family)
VCGAGGLFDGWFRMKTHCPTCDTKFSREEGFFLGAVFVNLAFTEVVMFLWLAVVAIATLPRPDAVLLVGGAAGVCLVLPPLLYPTSKTLWFAIHISMQPLEPEEEAERAAAHFERTQNRSR